MKLPNSPQLPLFVLLPATGAGLSFYLLLRRIFPDHPQQKRPATHTPIRPATMSGQSGTELFRERYLGHGARLSTSGNVKITEATGVRVIPPTLGPTSSVARPGHVGAVIQTPGVRRLPRRRTLSLLRQFDGMATGIGGTADDH